MPADDAAKQPEQAEPTAEAEAAAPADAGSTATGADAAGASGEDPSALLAEISRLQRELDEARERADRYHSNWQRSAADFQNWKRRTDQEKTELTRYAEGALTAELLRVLDDFERAFMSLPPELRMLTWIEGVALIGQKFYGVLQGHGLTPIEAEGQDFDPHVHEAVLREEDAEGAESLVVVQELQRGYRFHDRVLRPTMVKVGRPKADAPADASPTSASDDASQTASDDQSERPSAAGPGNAE
jgi:molecular chaperone GrpE